MPRQSSIVKYYIMFNVFTYKIIAHFTGIYVGFMFKMWVRSCNGSVSKNYIRNVKLATFFLLWSWTLTYELIFELHLNSHQFITLTVDICVQHGGPEEQCQGEPASQISRSKVVYYFMMAIFVRYSSWYSCHVTKCMAKWFCNFVDVWFGL